MCCCWRTTTSTRMAVRRSIVFWISSLSPRWGAQSIWSRRMPTIPITANLSRDKSNIGSKPLGLTYIIQKCWIKGEQGEEIETSRISWGTKHIDETADEALSPDTGSGTAKGEAIEFLRTVLANGPVKVLDIEAEARSACLLGKDQQLKQVKTFSIRQG